MSTKHEDSRLMLGIDLGGTKILAAVVNESGQILGTAKRKTRAEDGVDNVIERIASAAQKAVKKAHVDLSMIEAIGIGAPGVADHHSGVLEFAPNLPGWFDVPVGPRLNELLGVPVFLENDVNAGTFGEVAAGAGRGYRSVVGVFPGTGIGGGIVLDGRLWRGARNAAAEIGHIIMMIDGPLCGCGRRGCIEALASRTAIERDIWGEIRGGGTSTITDLVDPGDPHIRSGILAQALDEGDPVVTTVVGRAAYHLGIFTGSVVNAIDPDCVIYGGGLIEACADFLMPIIREHTYRYLLRPVEPEHLPILVAKLGDNATVIGAAMLARAAIQDRRAATAEA
jgi:glucokinase